MMPSRLPLLYFGFAHLCLGVAVALLAAFPAAFSGFFYHSRMLAVVHLVTLGWITSHILGALYLIAPMALRARLAATRVDSAAFWIYAVGVTGMVGHFWIDEMSGMLWGALMVLASVALVGARTVAALRGAPIAFGVKLHYALAFANVLAAGSLGLLLGWNRMHPVLGGEPLSNLFAHVHLAALGWATMTVFGSAQRLLPMLLPSAVPPAAASWATAALLETAVVGLTWSFLARRGPLAVFAVLAALAVCCFLALVVWMLRHRRRPGPGLPRFDATRLYAMQALLYLAAATAIGVGLAFAPRSLATLRWAKVYAVCSLLGFLGTMILGVAGRHVPVLFWTRTVRETGIPPALSPYRLRPLSLQAVELSAWSAGVPLLAIALWLEAAGVLRFAALLLTGVVAASAVNHVLSWRRARVLATAADGAG
jgi:hypothetical protein